MKRLILFCILFFLTNTKFSFSESVHDYFFSSKEEFLAKFKKHLDKDVYKRIDEIRCKFVVWHEENNYFRMILPISYEIPRKFSSTLMDLFTEFDNKNDNPKLTAKD